MILLIRHSRKDKIRETENRLAASGGSRWAGGGREASVTKKGPEGPRGGRRAPRCPRPRRRPGGDLLRPFCKMSVTPGSSLARRARDRSGLLLTAACESTVVRNFLKNRTIFCVRDRHMPPRDVTFATARRRPVQTGRMPAESEGRPLQAGTQHGGSGTGRPRGRGRALCSDCVAVARTD